MASVHAASSRAPWIIPATLYIETVANACTARCPMCSIDEWTRPTKVMSNQVFRSVIGAFEAVLPRIGRINLSGCGEPLLDKKIHDKVAFLKGKAPGVIVGFPTNCSELTDSRIAQLLDCGLDYLVCSIDGARKETHEQSRPGLDFDQVRGNVERLIAARDNGGHDLRIYVRSILQGFNDPEWPEVQRYWTERLDIDGGDDVGSFPMHGWPGSESRHGIAPPAQGEKVYCPYLNESLVIYADGRVGLCCVDDNGHFEIGNVLDEDPLTLFNRAEAFVTARTMMEEGRVGDHEFCSKCDAYVAVRRRSYPSDA